MNWADYIVVGFVVCGLLAATLWDLLNKKTREHKALLASKEADIPVKLKLAITDSVQDLEVRRIEIDAQSYSQENCWESFDKALMAIKQIKK